VTVDFEQQRSATGPAAPYWVAAGLLFVGSLVVFGRLAHLHVVCTYSDSDFYASYAPDAMRIAAGHFPAGRFQGPGYPVALALVRPVTGDLFTAGKAIAVVSATIAGLLAFLLFRDPWGDAVGLGAQLLLVSNPVFVRMAIEPVTDMPFLMLCMAAQSVFMARPLGVRWRTAGAGSLAGLAFLTRYNGVTLIAAFALAITILNLFDESRTERVHLLALLVLTSLTVSAPWLYANDRHRGAPLYNEDYLNIATEFYGPPGEQTSRDGLDAMAVRFHSYRDVLLYDPVGLIRRYPRKLAISIFRSFGSWPFAVAATIGLVVAWRRGPRKRMIGFGLPVATLFLLMALNHFEARYYLFAIAFYAALSALALQTAVTWLASRFSLRPKAVRTCEVAALIVAATVAASSAAKPLETMYAEEPREILGACAYLRGRNIRNAQILAYKPHVAFVCGQEAVFLPPFDSEPAMEHWVLESRARFLAIGPQEIRRRPQLAEWRDPSRAPAWLRPVWSDARLGLYEVIDGKPR
jgi:hypothetical protein